MANYKLQHNRLDCIGCGSCVAICPAFWEMNDDGKADIKKGKNLKNGWQELEIKDLKCNMEAAQVCPVNVIHIIDGKGKKLI